MEQQTEQPNQPEQTAATAVAGQPMSKRRKIIMAVSIPLAVIFFIIAAIGITFVSVWNNEINTVSSFVKLRERNDANKEGAIYRMDVHGDFYFDKFLQEGGAKSDSDLIKFITANITRGLLDMTIKESTVACSSFTATTESGDKLFARNYDYDKTNVCITLCDPGNGRYKSFSTVDLNYVGMDTEQDVNGLMNKITCLAAPFAPLDGINEAGVSCGIYMTYQGTPEDIKLTSVATNQNDPDKKDITSTTMLRMILDYAGSVDEAVALVSQYNLHDSANSSFHYMVADATGKSAILEWVPANGTEETDNDGTARQLVVTYNTDDDHIGEREAAADFQWVTNFIIQPGYYSSNEQKAGWDRYNRIYERLNATNGIVKDENAAMNILQEVGRRTWNGGGGCTVHSAIYNLTQKTVLWVANENYSDKTAVYTYSLTTGKLSTLS